jgi:hypothetical protein
MHALMRAFVLKEKQVFFGWCRPICCKRNKVVLFKQQGKSVGRLFALLRT